MQSSSRSLVARAPSASAALGPVNKWWVLVTVVFGAFVTILDNTIVNTALPKMQAVFGADLHQISYVATGYTLAQGVVVPATGFLANRYGVKRIYVWSLALFTIGSALCGLATSTAMIIAFRVLQGAGGAALFPLSFAILFATFAPEERGLANGFFGIPVLVAPAIGPTVGGYLAQYVDWRWIFYVNVPIGILGVIMARAILRETPPRPLLRFDARGFVLVALGLGLLLYGLSNLAYDGWNSLWTVSGPTVLSLVFLAVWIPVALRTTQPLLDLHLFTRRNYLAGNLVTWIGTIGLFGPAFLLPQYLQVLRGLAPFPAGMLVFTQGLGTVVGTVLGGRFYNSVSPRVLIPVGGLITVGTSLYLAQWATLTSPLQVLPWILFVRGIGLPLMLQSANTAALDGIVGMSLPGATTLNVVMRSVVGALSIAVLTNLLQIWTVQHNAGLLERLSTQSAQVMGQFGAFQRALVQQGISVVRAHEQALLLLAAHVAQQARVLGFQDVFWVTGVISIPLIFVAQAIKPRARGRSSAPVAPSEAA